MKKIISTILICSILLVGISSFMSFGIYTNDSTYNSCDEIQKNIEENINSYFLPAAYDISPFTVQYGDYWDEMKGFDCQNYYDNHVVRDERGNISVPPIYTLIVTDGFFKGKGVLPFHATYVIHAKNNKNNVEMTPSMWRVLHDSVYSKASEDSAVNAFIAPWTLYNDGVLYTWPELMAMSEEELGKLNFESYEFYTFVSGVKEALVERDWWKEEYQEKYDLLNLHRNDYSDAQPENETLTVDGKKVYLARINQEFTSGDVSSLNSIISVNIYNERFANELRNLDSDIKEKYSVLTEAIESEWKTNRRDAAVKYGNENYLSNLYTGIPPEAIALSDTLEFLGNYIDGEAGYKDYAGWYSGLQVFSEIENSDYTDDELKRVFEEFNYVISDDGAFNFELVNTVISNTKEQNIDYFVFDTSIVMSYEKACVLPWWRFATQELTTDYNIVYSQLADVDDFDRVIDRLEYLYDNYTPDEYKQTFGRNIEFVKEYANSNPPSTGDNSVLYLIISAAALAAMSAVVGVKKRRVFAE